MEFSGQKTGVGSRSLLQGIFPTQGSNLGLPHCRRILYQLSHKGSPLYVQQVIITEEWINLYRTVSLSKATNVCIHIILFTLMALDFYVHVQDAVDLAEPVTGFTLVIMAKPACLWPPLSPFYLPYHVSGFDWGLFIDLHFLFTSS